MRHPKQWNPQLPCARCGILIEDHYSKYNQAARSLCGLGWAVATLVTFLDVTPNFIASA